jgi:hypothetical protein
METDGEGARVTMQTNAWGIFCVYAFLNAATAFCCARYRKPNLHALEVLTYYLLSTMLVQNYSALLFMNLKYAYIPSVLGLQLADLVNRTVFYPFLIVLFLNQSIAVTTASKKIGMIAGYTILLTGMEWLDDGLGVHKHTHWKLWWSLCVWLTILLLTSAFMKFFRSRLKKENYERELYDGLE